MLLFCKLITSHIQSLKQFKINNGYCWHTVYLKHIFVLLYNLKFLFKQMMKPQRTLLKTYFYHHSCIILPRQNKIQTVNFQTLSPRLICSQRSLTLVKRTYHSCRVSNRHAKRFIDVHPCLRIALCCVYAKCCIYRLVKILYLTDGLVY